MTEQEIAELEARWRRAVEKNPHPRILTRLPLRTRLRLAAHRAVNVLGCCATTATARRPGCCGKHAGCGDVTGCAAPRHDGQDEPALLDAIRQLHAPVVRRFTSLKGTPGVFIHCHGCDLGPHPEDYPDWPCSTAELVYTPEEIAEVQA